MIRLSVLLTSLMLSTTLHGQEYTKVLEAPEGWMEEQFPVPPGFAQDIEFQGEEDIRFSPGWNDLSSDQFWAYVFVWNVEYRGELTSELIEQSLNLYYDGLMGTSVDGENRSSLPSGTTSTFSEVDGNFEGQVEVFDRFFTQSEITLHIRVSVEHCEELNQQMIRFDIASKSFDNHEAWDPFEEVILTDPCVEF
ncbi:MAG: hypothetical protein HWD92_11560 [Flavobacteriia bacterium]|nr:hypothetical protein [Flavobacteriia bacterium]